MFIIELDVEWEIEKERISTIWLIVCHTVVVVMCHIAQIWRTVRFLESVSSVRRGSLIKCENFRLADFYTDHFWALTMVKLGSIFVKLSFSLYLIELNSYDWVHEVTCMYVFWVLTVNAECHCCLVLFTISHRSIEDNATELCAIVVLGRCDC